MFFHSKVNSSFLSQIADFHFRRFDMFSFSILPKFTIKFTVSQVLPKSVFNTKNNK